VGSAVRRQTVLNVNDDQRSRHALSRLLRHAGYRVREATGARSLRLIAKGPPDLVVLGGPVSLREREILCAQLHERSGARPLAILHLVPKREAAAAREHRISPEEAVLATPADAVAVISSVAALLRVEEIALTELQARPWQAAFEAVRDGLCIVDTEGRVVQCNRAMSEVVGKPMGEILGRSCEDILREAQVRVFAPLLARMTQTRERESVVVPVGDRWYQAIADPLPRDGQPTGAVLSVSDVSDEVRAAAARARLLEVERARARDARILDLVFESTPSLLAYIDRDLRYVRVNARYAASLRRTVGEIIGRTVEEVIGVAPSAVDAIRRARDTGESLWLTETPLIIPQRAEEERFARYDVAVTPVTDEQGEVEGLVISVMDVSEKVRLREEEVEQERTSRQVAETLRADLGHRVKNSLMLLAGLLQMQISSDPESPAAVALRDTVARLLTVADLHARLNLPSAAEVNLLDTIHRIGEITRQVFAGRNVDIAVEGEPVGYPSAAVTAISVAVNELLTNAIKHGAPADGDRLRVQVNVRRHDEMLCISVWNTGNPVPEGFSIDDQTHMGLRLVRDLAKLRHGGSLTLRPRAGGTVAEMHLSDQSLRMEA
jgi:PAS domain S-box-containing protein